MNRIRRFSSEKRRQIYLINARYPVLSGEEKMIVWQKWENDQQKRRQTIDFIL